MLPTLLIFTQGKHNKKYMWRGLLLTTKDYAKLELTCVRMWKWTKHGFFKIQKDMLHAFLHHSLVLFLFYLQLYMWYNKLNIKFTFLSHQNAVVSLENNKNYESYSFKVEVGEYHFAPSACCGSRKCCFIHLRYKCHFLLAHPGSTTKRVKVGMRVAYSLWATSNAKISLCCVENTPKLSQIPQRVFPWCERLVFGNFSCLPQNALKV